ncbi:hypothetical protein [Mesoplasma photuris]|uniref:hypothetical protein n=1 Tax=Mesoplasma photuris TaxID=217731 RepID=UPI000A73C5E6|nr:hypothetical protein [Mesoplasma photuris]
MLNHSLDSTNNKLVYITIDVKNSNIIKCWNIFKNANAIWFLSTIPTNDIEEIKNEINQQEIIVK